MAAPTDTQLKCHPNIRAFFDPETVAIVGATDKPGIGSLCTSNLLGETGFRGKFYLINPTRNEVKGMRCYKKLEECPTVPELVFIVTPAKTVPGLVATCVDMKVKAVIVISSGFKEIGHEGQELESQISGHLKRGGGFTRLLGPNCFGVLDKNTNINATFATMSCLPGEIALLSQSGATMACLFEIAMGRGRGFSSLVSVGSMLDVGWADLLLYVGNDPKCKAVMMYIESLGNVREFLEAARQVALIKPVVVIKPGRTEGAAKAAVSHTGSLAGADDVVDMALERAGVIRVDTVQELSMFTEGLAMKPLPTGPKLAILTHAGGAGVIAADAAIRAGAELAAIPEEAVKALDPLVPPFWSRGNPLDITGGAQPSQFQACLDVLADLPGVDGIMIFEGNLPICPPTALATTIVRFAKEHPKKTVLASMMSGDDGESGRKLLYRTGVPCTVNPDDASRLFATMWKYRKIVDAAHAPCPPAVGAMTHDQLLEAVDKAEAILQRVRATGRTVLTEAESKEVLKAHGIPVAETVAAKTEDEAVAAAERMGFPVVVKLLSETITHKSDVGGVILNVQGPSQVRAAFKSIQESLSAKFGQAKVATLFDGVTVQPMLDLATSYELLLGSSADPQFGPVICFGTGGKLVEVFRDRALALPPLSTPMAKSLIAKTKISKALAGTRGQPPVDNERLVSILVAFSNMISHHPLIKEADVNPLLASSKRISAVDARIVLYPASDPHIPALALAPYPLRHVLKASVPGVGQVVVRPLVPEDEEMWTQFTGKQESRAGVIDALFSSFAYSTVLAAVAPGNKIVATARIAKIGMGVSEGSFAVQAPPEVLESETLTVLVKHALDVARTEGFSSLSTAPEQAKLLAKFGFGNGKLSLQ